MLPLSTFPLTISQISKYIHELLRMDATLQNIWVEGEVSGFRQYDSGHCYFSLKEGKEAVLRAVMWRSYATKATLPNNGDAVLAHGYVSFYEPRGDVQFYVDTLQPAGVGLLHARFEALKARLEAEGLFDTARKRPLRQFPRQIGIVTSPQGAALQDMLNILQRRYPLVEVLVSPCLVQGDQSASSIVQALQRLYPLSLDAIIVARGGGSLEDLWSFNEEVVARAVFASPTPVITAVGHETDTTIVDYVADLRAPTPSAAAELVVPDRLELLSALQALRQRLETPIIIQLGSSIRQLTHFRTVLQHHNPQVRLSRARQQVDELLQRATACVQNTTTMHRTRLDGMQARLVTLNPHATLERGYAIVRRLADGFVVTQADQVQPGDELSITFRDGTVVTQVIGDR